MSKRSPLAPYRCCSGDRQMSDTPDETIEESSEVAEVPEPEMFGCPMTDSRGQLVLHVDRDRYLDVAKQLADEGYAMCVLSLIHI